MRDVVLVCAPLKEHGEIVAESIVGIKSFEGNCLRELEIVTKYYKVNALVKVCSIDEFVEDSKAWLENCHAFIYSFGDTSGDSISHQRNRLQNVLENSGGVFGEVQLCLSSSSDESLLDWCIDHQFELVDGKIDSQSNNCTVSNRILEALESSMWPSMDVTATSDEQHPDREHQLEEMDEMIRRAREIRRMDLSWEERRDMAGKVAMEMWNEFFNENDETL